MYTTPDCFGSPLQHAILRKPCGWSFLYTRLERSGVSGVQDVTARRGCTHVPPVHWYGTLCTFRFLGGLTCMSVFVPWKSAWTLCLCLAPTAQNESAVPSQRRARRLKARWRMRCTCGILCNPLCNIFCKILCKKCDRRIPGRSGHMPRNPTLQAL